jgi:hypothetical protein
MPASPARSTQAQKLFAESIGKILDGNMMQAPQRVC